MNLQIVFRTARIEDMLRFYETLLFAAGIPLVRASPPRFYAAGSMLRPMHPVAFPSLVFVSLGGGNKACIEFGLTAHDLPEVKKALRLLGASQLPDIADAVAFTDPDGNHVTIYGPATADG